MDIHINKLKDLPFEQKIHICLLQFLEGFNLLHREIEKMREDQKDVLTHVNDSLTLFKETLESMKEK